MTLLIVLFVLAGLFEILMPIFVARWSVRRYRTGWRLFFIGMLTFFLSQVGHIPFLQWLTGAFMRGTLPNPSPEAAPYFNAVVLGLAAGIFEETARLVAYLLLKARASRWGAAITLGAGHGGLESILVGIAVLGNLALVIIAPTVSAGSTLLPEELRQSLLAAADTFWAQPWYMPLLGAFERAGAVLLHILLSVMVWLAVQRRNALWFVAAVLWHALVDGVIVLASSFGASPLAIEGIFLLMTLMDVALLVFLWRRYARAEEQDPPALT